MPKAATMQVPDAKDILADFEAKGAENVRKIWARQGAGDKVFGVRMGDVRAWATKLKTRQHDLGLALWGSGWYEARVLACMLMDPAKLTEADAVRLAGQCDSAPIIDELTGKTLEESNLEPTLRAKWLDSADPLLGRAGWNLMTYEVQQDIKGLLELDALIAKIEAELPAAPKAKKEAMNVCLLMIGVHHPSYTDKAVATGERLGRWDTRPVPKGCTSSYPPEAIPAMIALRHRRSGGK